MFFYNHTQTLYFSSRLSMLLTMYDSWDYQRYSYGAFFIGYLILPSALTRVIFTCFFYIYFFLLPLEDAIWCFQKLYTFVKYLSTHSKEIILQDMQTQIVATGHLLYNLFKLLTVELPALCKTFFEKGYALLCQFRHALFNYFQNQAA